MRMFSRPRRMSSGLLRRRHKQTGEHPSARAEEVLAHFRRFTATRVGVEAYLEPPTANDPHTLVLVARSGEWTRRRVPHERAARKIGEELAIPVYDVNLTGYPSSMRAWSSAQRRKR